VEVPCLVDDNGVQPTAAGALPPQLAALNRACINVQELAVRAVLSGDRDAVHQALLLDPLTAAACTVPQIHAMADEMLAAQARWLPQFNPAS
jgi:alpha-galactosidase